MPGKKPTSFRLPDITIHQLALLIDRTGMTQAEVVSTAIDRMYREEIRRAAKSMEYKFTFYVYHLNAAEAEAIRAKLEAVILAEVEAAGKFTSPLDAEINPQEEGDGQEAA